MNYIPRPQDRTKVADFSYTDYGYNLDCRVTFRWDADWDVYESEIYDAEGEEVGCELDRVGIQEVNSFTKQTKFRSIYDLIMERAWEKTQ